MARKSKEQRAAEKAEKEAKDAIENSEDVKEAKRWVVMIQVVALICDFGAALLAVITFSDVTYCCGKPILNIAGDFPWKTVIRVATWLYLLLVCAEVYPVLRKGFPFNLVNPFVGFCITFAMFFDDSRNEALILWGVESGAIMFEFLLYKLKVNEHRIRTREIKKVGRKTQGSGNDEENGGKAAKEVQRTRRVFLGLKRDQLRSQAELWYIGFGCYANIALSAFMLVLILVIAAGEGLCIYDFSVPNPFDLNQRSRCPLCDGLFGSCEICDEGVEQCFFPYA